MYKVLVVDDEELICEGMKSKLERLENPAIGDIFLAYDAEEALSVICSVRPEIVITDIRMPGMSGLELVRTVVKQFADTRCIILSGYDEFQYAKDALRLGVADYLLKPASLNELKEVMDKVVAELREEERKTIEQESMSRKSREVLFESFLARMAGGSLSDEAAAADLPEDFLSFFSLPSFCLGLFITEGGSQEGGRLLEAVRKQLAVTEGGNRRIQPFAFLDHRSNLVLIFNCESEDQYGKILQEMKALMSQADIGGVCRAAALSEVWKDAAGIVHLYRQAVKAASYRIMNRSMDVLEYSLHKERSGEIPATGRHMSALREAIKVSRPDKAGDVVDSLISREFLEGYTIDVVRNLYMSIAQCIGSLPDGSSYRHPGEGIPSFDNFHSLEDIRIFLKNLIYDACRSIQQDMGGKSIECIVRNHIKKNLDKDVDMAQIANTTSMSYSYFSRQFKKQTGMNFSEYLIRVRMEEAVRLLDDLNLKIYEVSEMVGYENAKHFTKIFGRYYGMSPAEYRRRNREG